VDPACPINWDHPLNYGLVAEWAIIPNSGWRGGLTLRDLVKGGKNSHDGTLTNMALSSSTSGWNGPKSRSGGYGSLAFDGSNDYVNVADAAVQKPTAITLAAWINVISYATASGYSWFVAKSNNSASVGYGLCSHPDGSVPISGNKVGFYVNHYTTGGVAYVARTSVPVGTWFRMVGTYDGASVTFYLNGAPVNSMSYSTAITHTSNPFQIGASGLNGLNANFLADGVTLLSRAWTAADVVADYLETKSGNPNRWNWVDTGRRVWAVSAGAVSSHLLNFRRRMVLAG